MHLKLVVSGLRIILLLKSGFSLIFFPSRRLSARRFVRGSDCKQSRIFLLKSLKHCPQYIFSQHKLSSAILADNSFADHTIEVPWDSAAARPLPSDLQSRSDLPTQTVGSPWRSGNESMGLPKDTWWHDQAFCSMIKTPRFFCSSQNCGNRSLPQLWSEDFFFHLWQLF